MAEPLRKENRTYTYKDYLEWPEDKLYELIDGVPYLMAPPERIHQKISFELARQIGNYLVGKTCEVYTAPFGVRLPKENEPDEFIKNALLPDIAVICDKKKLDKAGCRGAPDLIIEILSPSNASHDTVIKLRKYEQAGVKEYWIVDPIHKTINVFTIEKNNKYGKSDFYNCEDNIKVSIFPDLEIDLKTVFTEG